MTWTAYHVSLRMLSPMHIGWRKLGNLQQTRAYITGRTLWGALTARITREQGRNDYREIGRLVDEYLTFTYFYPSTKPNTVTHWPWPNQWDEFAWTFLSSYASTALEDGHSAEAGSLHETEFIAPYARDEEQKPVFLVGYIFERGDCNPLLHGWRKALDRLQIGGERSYGWGRVRLEGTCELVTTNKCFGYDLFCDKDHPQITVPEDKELLAHTVDPNNDHITGSIEPLLGRETQKSGFGESFSDVEICWVPGSKAAQSKPFQIQQKGIWRPA
ncbi:MAG TPA: hypothetical protein VGL94_11020 [Ktedonobacteraceae bacterium]